MGINQILKRRNSIYGFCAIWIILFHVSRKIDGAPYIPLVTDIISIGNGGVDIFFFLSGLSLALSVKRHDYCHNGWGTFYRRRVTRLLLPYCIIGIPGYLWSAFVEHTHHDLLWDIGGFIYNFSSASFWLKGSDTTWFVYGIAVFYIIFPLLYRWFEATDNNTQLICKIILITVCSIVM